MAEGGHIHYGSLEKGERERLSKLSQLEDETKRKLDKLKTQVVPKSNETTGKTPPTPQRQGARSFSKGRRSSRRR